MRWERVGAAQPGMSDEFGLSLSKTVRDWWKQNVAQRGTNGALRSLFSELWGFLRDSTPEQRRRRYGDMEYDWDHRVDTTSATIGWRTRLLGIFHSPYQPTEPALFHEMVSSLSIPFPEFTFIDLGSGKGRTLLMAADYPFRKIIGVELLPDLHQTAEKNVKAYSHPNQKCFSLESICADARDFEFPAEPTVLYLFNPLPQGGLALVVKNLQRSLNLHPRPLFVLYHNPEHDLLFAENPGFRRACGTHQFSIYESSIDQSRPAADKLR